MKVVAEQVTEITLTMNYKEAIWFIDQLDVETYTRKIEPEADKILRAQFRACLRRAVYDNL